MTTSLRWGLGVLASLALQIGCCSIHVDYEGPHCGLKHACLETGCPETPCETEGACTINGLGHIRNSIAALKSHAHHGLTCGSGCGEVYWDEHINEPPTCDPCGCNNEWVGGGGHYRPWYAKLRDMWGYPYFAGHCSDCGDHDQCTDCGHRSSSGQCSHCGHGTHVRRGMTTTFGSESFVIENESDVVISSPEAERVTVPSPDPEGVPTPAKPKRMPSVLPGDSEPAPNSPSDKESSGGKTAQAKKPSSRAASVIAMEPVHRVPAKPASGRHKLTTKSR